MNIPSARAADRRRCRFGRWETKPICFTLPVIMFNNTYARLPQRFFARAQPDQVPQARLLAWNQELATELGLLSLPGDPQTLAQLFSGNTPPNGAEPIALAYAGHQFGQFVPQLGDGRATLLGEVVAANGQRYDLQLKGSGPTFFSRGGDGKSWLGPVIREYVVSEAMHHLGVATTRALAAVQTGETVYRPTPLPGGVLTRVASSHIRVGTFQYFAAREDTEGLKILVDYAIQRHFPDAADDDQPILGFFSRVLERQAALIAHWMDVGFIHGVMNTDNTSIAGETIDYGPCAFMDEFRFTKVFSSIDRRGRYAYGNQATIAQWNLARLAECLLLLDVKQSDLEDHLNRFPNRFEELYRTRMGRKLGLTTWQPGDDDLIRDWLVHLEARELDYTESFRKLGQRIAANGAAVFGEFESRWRQRIANQPETPQQIKALMDSANPIFIPRNHQIERAISAAVEGEFKIFQELNQVVRHPFSEQPDYARYARPPLPEERVQQTFCGT